MRTVRSHSIPLVTRAHVRGAGTVARRAWRTTYVRRLVAADALCALVAAAVVVVLGPGGGPLLPAMVVVTPLVWVAAMTLARDYEQRFLWDGAEEFRRVLFASALMVAAVGTVSWGLRLELARSFVVLTVPLACLLTLAQRAGQRWWLHRERAQGRALQTTLLVGHHSSVAALHEQLASEARHGYRVVGCCLPAPGERTFDGLPVLGDLDDVVRVVDFYEVDTVAVLPTPELDGGALRRLGWDLEHTRAELLLAPALTELAGPRVSIRPSCGLPLLHVERPELRGVRRLVKVGFDLACAAVITLLVLPVLLAVAVAVRLSGPGPVLAREERLGRGGRVFGLLSFRTTDVPVADDAAATPLHGGQLTPVGRFLRRHALDQLPQLLNVLRGEMSLVGPRPPRAGDVESSGIDLHRRLLVKPGVTGLWQVSGRSDLSWEDAARIDVRYVENWSLALDLLILGRTLQAGRRAGPPE